jgi:hypothetical protein
MVPLFVHFLISPVTMTVLVNVVSVLAVVTGFLQLLGPAPDTRVILREHSTGVTPIAPLAAMFACGWIWCESHLYHFVWTIRL